MTYKIIKTMRTITTNKKKRSNKSNHYCDLKTRTQKQTQTSDRVFNISNLCSHVFFFLRFRQIYQNICRQVAMKQPQIEAQILHGLPDIVCFFTMISHIINSRASNMEMLHRSCSNWLNIIRKTQGQNMNDYLMNIYIHT